jgi:ketosteroid isomerase-like protein
VPATVVEAWFGALTEGRHDDAWALMDAEGTYWVLRGRRTMPIATFAAVYPDMITERFDGGLRFTPGPPIVDGEQVVVESEAVGTLRTGGTYVSAYVFVFRVVEGRIRSVREYGDTHLAWQVFGGGS